LREPLARTLERLTPPPAYPLCLCKGKAVTPTAHVGLELILVGLEQVSLLCVRDNLLPFQQGSDGCLRLAHFLDLARRQSLAHPTDGYFLLLLVVEALEQLSDPIQVYSCFYVKIRHDLARVVGSFSRRSALRDLQRSDELPDRVNSVPFEISLDSLYDLYTRIGISKTGGANLNRGSP